ncbi:MAG: chemotaxis protein CheD [Promethearchaeota archaeon]
MSNAPDNINNRKKVKKSIGLGEIVFTDFPNSYDLLGIGTCIAIYLYDIKKRNYIIAHTILPKIDEFPGRMNKNMPGKFVDLAIKLMINALIKNGSRNEDIKAKLVGGAQIFQKLQSVGIRNIKAAHETLTKAEIKLISEDVGGIASRSIIAFNPDGTIDIKQKKNFYSI